MRAWWKLLLAVAIAPAARAQEGGGDPPPAPAAEEPKEPPVWKLSEKDARSLEKLVKEFLGGPTKDRAEVLAKIEKLVEKSMGGHSVLEDVEALVGMANRARAFNPKLKKGQVPGRSSSASRTRRSTATARSTSRSGSRRARRSRLDSSSSCRRPR
jgi:hypothetical protein